MPPEPAASASGLPARLAPFLLLAALGGVVYANSLDVPFIFDDNSITNNPHLTQLWPVWEAARSTPQSTTAGRPLVTLTLAVNYALGGYDVFGYHVFNLIVHVLNAWLLFAIVQRTLMTGRLGRTFTPRASRWIAGAASALWIVHPLQTEAVTYVVQRTELLMALFYLLTLYTAIRAWDSPRAPLWMGLSVACCALGMMSKEVMVSAPIMVVLYDLAFREWEWRKLAGRRWPLYAGLASTWIILAALMIPGPRDQTVGFHLGISMWRCVRTECWAMLHYLQLALWPMDLSLDYGPWFDVTTLQAGTGAITVAALVSLTIWGWWRVRWLGFLGAWMLLILAPTTSVVPIYTEPVAERRMYLPLAAVMVSIVLVVLYLGRRFERWLFPAEGRPLWTPGLLGAAGLIILGGLWGFMTIQRNQDYSQPPLVIWYDAFRKQPGNNRAFRHVQSELIKLNRGQELLTFLREAVQLNPDDAEVRSNYGAALMELGYYTEALRQLDLALALKPELSDAHLYLGLTLQRLGEADEALDQFRQAVQFSPYDTPALCELGIELAHHGEYAKAIRNFELALTSSPQNPAIHYHLGRALAKQGNVAGALEHYREAAQIKPDYVEPRLRMAQLLAEQGNETEAARWFHEVLRLDPKNRPAQQGLDAIRPSGDSESE